jgi:hypothetical protein
MATDKDFDRDFQDIRTKILACVVVLGAQNKRSKEETEEVASMVLGVADPLLLIAQRFLLALERVADAQEARRSRGY